MTLYKKRVLFNTDIGNLTLHKSFVEKIKRKDQYYICLGFKPGAVLLTLAMSVQGFKALKVDLVSDRLCSIDTGDLI